MPPAEPRDSSISVVENEGLIDRAEVYKSVE